MDHVFISYVRENSAAIDKLAAGLRSFGIRVWLDREHLAPGLRWKDAIRRAIRDGAFFIACFSSEYNEKSKSYMNEELTLAIEELRQRTAEQVWFIPALLNKCIVPDRNIGGGESLDSIQYVPLYDDWNEGLRRIASVIRPHTVPGRELRGKTQPGGFAAARKYDLIAIDFGYEILKRHGR